ncbi:meiosis-specific kinetochore protein isoform 2-T2 [Porphyrio hochstetteri]
MERSRWKSALRGGKESSKKRCLSPLPAAPVGRPRSRAGASQPGRRRLFGSAGPRGPQPGCLKGKFSVKTLPKIKENLDVSEVSHSSNQSNQVNVKEATDLEKNEEEIEESTAMLKESQIMNLESLKNAEMTSGTEMTLPTGVSTILLECLDADSTANYNTGANDSLSSWSSPETFRDDGSERSNVYSGQCKNSTLLDSSKAVTIDKIPQIPNLSSILEPVQEDFQDQYPKRKRPSNPNYSSSAVNVSTILAGKKVCKITAARERTPDLKTGMRCPSPLGPEGKPDNPTAKPKKLKCKKEEKEKASNVLEKGKPLFSPLDTLGNASARSVGLTAEVLPSRQTDAVVMSSTMLTGEEKKALKNPGYAQPAQLDVSLSLSPVCKASPGEGLFLNTTGPDVNSEEIVAASLSSERKTTPQSPEEKTILEPLCATQEICSIVRTSPRQKPSQHRRIPVNTKPFCLPQGLPEDIITSTKNWIYCKRK